MHLRNTGALSMGNMEPLRKVNRHEVTVGPESCAIRDWRHSQCQRLRRNSKGAPRIAEQGEPKEPAKGPNRKRIFFHLSGPEIMQPPRQWKLSNLLPFPISIQGGSK
jgi:hypothetical protein